MKNILLILILILIPLNADAYGTWENVCKAGYGVIQKTSIYGQFDGCTYNKIWHFTNGLIFQCQEYKYMYYYNPQVYILSNQYGNLKVIIENNEFLGTLYK